MCNFFDCYYLLLSSDSYTEEEIQLLWSKNDSVQRNENLTLPQFVLLDVDTHRCHISYITGRLFMEVVVLPSGCAMSLGFERDTVCFQF